MQSNKRPFEASSFVIRIIHSTSAEVPTIHRGTIRHVQSNEEIQFSMWEEAEAFLKRFVSLETNNLSEEHDSDET